MTGDIDGSHLEGTLLGGLPPHLLVYQHLQPGHHRHNHLEAQVLLQSLGNLSVESLFQGLADVALLHDLHLRHLERIIRWTGEDQLEGRASSLPRSHIRSIFVVLGGQWNLHLQPWATGQDYVSQAQVMHRSHLIFLHTPKKSGSPFSIPII